MKKLSITLLSLSLTSLVVGQNTTTDKQDVKKEEQYENNYKGLSNFYVNSDGLVVYKRSNTSTQETTATNNSDSSEQTTTASYNEQETYKSSPSIIKKEAYTKTEIEEQPKKYEDDSEPVLIRPTRKAPINQYSAEEQTSTPYTPPPASGGALKKEALTIDESISINSKSRSVNNSDEQTVNFGAINASNKEIKSTTKSTAGKTDAKKKYKKYNSYEKRPSAYKSIEEAALAVDAMIEELKRNQGQSTGAKSMSSRLSTGANRASLRKKPLSNISSPSGFDYDSPSTSNSKTNKTVNNEYDSEWGEDPTYYINGSEVDKEEVDLLKKKDIIRKEFKIRNTASGNPNGEVWYQVKDLRK